MKVFISSTCYDLIDIRAELEALFRGAGVIPLASDSTQSDFIVHPDKNSIETCLVNVRDSDYFIIILSRRYGPRLGKCGFEDISATHLEYREAKKHNKKIWMYVRDRLEADHSSWKKNERSKSFKTSWLSDDKKPNKKDFGLFELLEEHTKLLQNSSSGNNWMTSFSNILDLKVAVLRDFRELFNKANAESLIQSGNFPCLSIVESHVQPCEPRDNGFILRLVVSNIGRGTAVGAKVTINDVTHSLKLLPQDESHLIFPFFMDIPSNLYDIYTEITFSTFNGHKIKQHGRLKFSRLSPHHLGIDFRYELDGLVLLSQDSPILKTN